MTDFYTIVILKNMETDSHKLTFEHMSKLRDTINSLPDSEEGLMIKLAFADAFIDALNQIDSNSKGN